MRDGIRLYWDRDETAIATTAKNGNYCVSIALNILKDREDAEECVDEIAGLLYAMPEISADERLTAVMEVLEERGITTETLAEITGIDLDLIESAREYPAKTDYRTKYELSSVVMMIYFILKEIIDENK